MDVLLDELTEEMLMIAMSKNRYGEAFAALVTVAFHRGTGKVLGTFVHGSHGAPDEAAANRDGERFIAELRERLGAHADIDSVRVSQHELEGAWVERVDPKTRKVIKTVHADHIRATHGAIYHP
jgi:hypothetical protein